MEKKTGGVTAASESQPVECGGIGDRVVRIPPSSMTAEVQCGLLSREDGIQTHTQLFFMAWDTQEGV